MRGFYLIIFFVINVYHITAQNIQVWPEKFEEVTYFDVIDMTLKSGQFYKESQISVKAGEGAFFFTVAGAFFPQIYITDTLMQKWTMGSSAEFGPGLFMSKISIAPKTDTTIKIIYSTVDKDVTGDYIYGYRILSAEQMDFESSDSYCDKLSYFISNWQCMWGLVSIPDYTPSGVLGESSAKNSLVKGGIGALQITGITDYHEILYKLDNAALAKNKYDEVVTDTRNCLQSQEWEILTNDVINSSGVVEKYETNFIIRGASAKDPSGSFVISQSCDGVMGCNVYIDFY